MNKQIEEMHKYCQFFKDGNCTICEELLVDCHSDCPMCEFAKRLLNAGYRKQSEVAFEVIDKFRDELINIFIDMCRGNDYNKINLLQIGDAIDACYDSYIAELKKKYIGEQE